MSNILELFQAISLGLVLLLPLANPLPAVAIFLGLSGNMTKAERHHQSLMAAIYVFVIMCVALYAGTLVMNTFGISIPGLRIAGGLIIVFIGFRMLFHPGENQEPDEIDSKLAKNRQQKLTNIAFVPLAMPSTAGPGTIAMIISSASSMPNTVHFSPWVLIVAPVLTFAIIALILWLSLLSSETIMRLFGTGGIDTISRLMGFLLVCMGVQFLINGILEIITTFNATT